MSTNKREPLLSRKEITDRFMYGRYIKDKEDGFTEGSLFVRDVYEAARAKDAELIQRLVDEMASFRSNAKCVDWRQPWVQSLDGALELAAAEGFKPTEQ